MKFKTVYKGEKAIVINRNGAVEQIEGPKRVFLLLSRLEKLKNHIADLNEYLVIEYVNGQIEHKPG
jgi:vacuolar-type H+-ATPase subunit B/Vma2